MAELQGNQRKGPPVLQWKQRLKREEAEGSKRNHLWRN
uniref:Uncharacterized protein n=1 Tax=Arundo donax TaxID=35708 RepID=A0A0A9C7R7_ARUDO